MNEPTNARTLEPADADDIAETLDSRGYRQIALRLHQTIEDHRIQLEAKMEERETNFQRGVIAGLRTALQIPEILQSEARRHEQQHPQPKRV